MDPFFAVAVEKLIFLNREIVPESNGRFVRFEPTYDSADSKNGLNSVVSFGRVVYTVDDVVKKSPTLFVKTIPKCPFFPEFAGFHFTNESHFYTQVLPFMARNTDPLGTVINLFPKFYTCSMNATAPVTSVGQSWRRHCLTEGVMVFEDLQARGYVPCAKVSFLDLDHLSLMMRKLGQFHAYSYAFKSRGDLGRKFHSLIGAFTDIFFVSLGECRGLVPASCLWALDCLLGDVGGREFLARNGRSLEELRRYFRHVEDEYRQLFGRHHDPEMAVLCHGDPTVPNTLFRYGEDGASGKPVDMKMIDMADCKLTSPAIDISTVMYLHTDQRTRDLHWDTLMDVYMDSVHETLDTCCGDGMKAVAGPSKEDIEGQMKKYARHGFFVATFYLGALIAQDRRLPVDQFTSTGTWDTLDMTQWDNQQHIEYATRVGGEWANLAMADLLKDVIKRDYI